MPPNRKLFLGSIFVSLLLVSFIGWYYQRSRRPAPVVIPPRPEVSLTIIPGWNLRQLADYLVAQGFASNTAQVLVFTGEPAERRLPALLPFAASGTPGNLLIWQDKPRQVSWEGYFAPETIRVFADAPLKQVLEKFILERQKQLLPFRPAGPTDQRSWHQILTMASLIEKEVKFDSDRALVADILWRRYRRNWALQVDSAVHYAINKTGTVFTTAADREVASPWNTYRYPGLPPGPISTPGLASIKAVLNPEPNRYWYFLSGREGKIYYAKTLAEHNRNKKYL